MMTPGRFVMQADTTLKSASPSAFAERPIAVVAGSRHEAFLKAFYPQSKLVTFETPALARNALKTGHVQGLFGDAISLSYWLNGAEAAGRAARVLCRLAALHRDEEYLGAAVIARDADYRGDAGRLLDEHAARAVETPRAAALYGLALAQWLGLH